MVIKVVAHLIPLNYRVDNQLVGTPRYSLVVQGKFTGQLQSNYNPAWDGTSPTLCNLPVAHISSAPALLSNDVTPTFTFRTTDDPAVSGFQCKLSGSGGTTAAAVGRPLQGWTACSSPKTFTFTGGNDGPYLFQVRAVGMLLPTTAQCLSLADAH